MGKNGRFTSQGIPIVFMYSDHPSGISDEEERRMRRVLKENKIYGHLPQTTPKLPSIKSINVREEKEAYYRRSAARIPSEVHTWNARVFITDAAGRTVEWEAGSYSSATGSKLEVGSVSKCPAADSLGTGGSVLKRPRMHLGEASQVLVGNLNPGQDSSLTGSKAEVEVGSVSKCPDADSSAARGSVLKRPRVDLGEASHVLAGDLKPGQDSSATGTIEEVNGGSVLNKDLGGSSEIVVNNLNPGGDPFVDASSDT